MLSFVVAFLFLQTVYIQILKGECKMSNVTIQKRGKYYQYKFEVLKVDNKRKFINKSGFETKDEQGRWYIGTTKTKHRRE